MNLRRLYPLALGLVPVAFSVAWAPLRRDLPNTGLAVLLVLCVGLVAIAGGRLSAYLGAFCAAVSFAFFDAWPYGQLVMTYARDTITTILLACGGMAIGEMCVRLREYRQSATRHREDFGVMTTAAHLMTLGEDASVVVGALAGELVARVGLSDCDFQYGPPLGDQPYLAREGTLVDLRSPRRPSDPASERVDLPVWVGREVIGHYRLWLAAGNVLSAERLVAAVGIAEQAGAALAAYRPTPWPAPVRQPPRLRLVR